MLLAKELRGQRKQFSFLDPHFPTPLPHCSYSVATLLFIYGLVVPVVVFVGQQVGKLFKWVVWLVSGWRCSS